MAARSPANISLILLAMLFLVCLVLWQASKGSGFSSGFMSQTKLSEKIITIHGTRISVDVADTQVKRQKGLSGRDSLKDGSGLLMVFDSDVSPGIWMKDMRFPIDVVWIDKNWIVVEVTPSITPDTYPGVYYPKNSLVRYVLELPAGFSDIHNIEVGNTVQY